MNLIKEIIHIIRYTWCTSREDKAFVIYAEHKGYYPNFEGIIKELTQTHHQTLCYITSEAKDPILKTDDPHIKPFYINVFVFLFFAFVNCKVFLLTLTELHQLHLKRSVHDVFYIYIFHALYSTHMTYRAGAFDYYDSVLCVGPHQIQELRKYEQMHHTPKKQLIEGGYYRLERIYNAYQKYKSENVHRASPKTTILIATHWAENNILEYCGKELITVLLRVGYNVIVRPHPEALRRAPKLIKSLEEKFQSNQNFILEKSIVTDDSLLKADVLISEGSGITFEYAFGTERPVLFLDVPFVIKNKSYKELDMTPLEVLIRQQIGVFVSPKELGQIPSVIDDMMVRRQEFAEQIIPLRKKYVYHFGHSSEVSAQHVMDVLHKRTLRSLQH